MTKNKKEARYLGIDVYCTLSLHDHDDDIDVYYDDDDDDDITNNKGRYEGDEGCRKLPPVEHCTKADDYALLVS